LVDQISEGQIEWDKLEDDFDVVSIGYGEDNRRYPVCEDLDKWSKKLKKQFPDEETGIDEFVKLVKLGKGVVKHRIILKMLPLWLSLFLVNTGIVHFFTKLWKEPLVTSTKNTIQKLTSNKDLQAVMCYSWGDYGTPPAKSNWSTQTLLHNHYMHGGYYPIGGASEFAYNMIPVIERTGGKVLVRAEVEEILYNGTKAMGVKVKKGNETYNIQAPIVISDAGLYNTFQKLLPPKVAKTSYYHEICKQLKPAAGCMSIFVGFDKSSEELNLRKDNHWAFTTNDMGINFDEYIGMSADKAIDEEVPLMFVSFPSAKDPNWKNHPGRENKSTMAIVTLGNWDWYKRWENTPLKKRGEDYEEFKKSIGQRMIDRCCDLFPQIKDHIDFVDIGTPVTHNHYIAAPYGEIYGLDHTIERMDASLTAKLRPKTDIPGLYMTGQDVLICGFTGAIYGGLIAAGAVLERNVMTDLLQVQKIQKRHTPLGKKMD
jgi:all-trans-retinol 13,14-reductase